VNCKAIHTPDLRAAEGGTWELDWKGNCRIRKDFPYYAVTHLYEWKL